MSLTQPTVQASPGTLGVGFQIETRDSGHAMVQAVGGHKLTPAGQIAVLGAINTYLSGLSASNFAALVGAGGLVRISAGSVTFPCQTADAATVATTLKGILTTAANVARG